ncbi:DsrE family protein [Sulfurimonas sp.]|nr:DsrE family protein [Sulfurimonas sp.]
MKYIFLLLLVLSTSQAKDYKAVFDCSSKSANFIFSRMMLIERTMNMIQEDGDTTTFALTIHGGCAPIISKNFDEVVEDDDLELTQKSQEQIIRLAEKKGVDITVCAISLNTNNIEEEDVLPFVKISKNSFIDTIGYQNDGYALMTFK